MIHYLENQLIHTKLDCKINLSFMYAVYYQGYSKMRLDVPKKNLILYGPV